MSYCMDTSSLIAAWMERYPIRNFPRFWALLEGMIDDGHLLSPDEVRIEVRQKSDGLGSWVNGHPEMFVLPEREVQEIVRDILAEYPELTKQLPGRNSADPFVIALAKHQQLIVVTEESPGGSKKRPRIPLVCAHYKVECVNLLKLIQDEDWVIS